MKHVIKTFYALHFPVTFRKQVKWIKAVIIVYYFNFKKLPCICSEFQVEFLEDNLYAFVRCSLKDVATVGVGVIRQGVVGAAERP